MPSKKSSIKDIEKFNQNQVSKGRKPHATVSLTQEQKADVYLQRYIDVQKWILLKVPKEVIIDSLMTTYDMSESAADKFIHLCIKKIQEGANKSREEFIQDIIISYQDLYAEAKSKGNISEARACKAQLSKLLGLDAAQKLDISGTLNHSVNIKVEMPLIDAEEIDFEDL